MTGLLVGVVGPSGVGKDSVMEALAEARPGIHLVRRVITRPTDAGGEAFDGVNEAEFDRRVDAGHFALHWPAHGLRYGVPASETEPAERGETCLVNLSRAVLPEAERRFASFITLLLTAPVQVLAQRLKARGRETADEIDQRLSRATFALPKGLSRVIEIANDGTLENTVTQVLAALDAHQSERT